MADIVNAFFSYQNLLPLRYEFVLGRKGVTININLSFAKSDCFHLAGLQHLKDRPNLNKNRAKLYDEILSGTILEEHLLSSSFYPDISNRVKLLPLLEPILDSNSTIFKYNRKNNCFSIIQADFMLKNTSFADTIYLFLSKSNIENNYVCKSFFPDNKRDYSLNQSSWTLLYKKKVNTLTNKEIILYNRYNN